MDNLEPVVNELVKKVAELSDAAVGYKQHLEEKDSKYEPCTLWGGRGHVWKLRHPANEVEKTRYFCPNCEADGKWVPLQLKIVGVVEIYLCSNMATCKFHIDSR